MGAWGVGRGMSEKKQSEEAKQDRRKQRSCFGFGLKTKHLLAAVQMLRTVWLYRRPGLMLVNQDQPF